MNRFFLTTFVLIVELTKEKRSSRWKKRNKACMRGPGIDPILSRKFQGLDFMRSFGHVIPAANIGAF